MKIQQEGNYIRPSIKPAGFSDFLGKVLASLTEEIQLVADTFYNYNPDDIKDYLGKEDVFTLNETAWVSLFNNAIIKTFPKTATMQEFGVWGEEGSEGRCDLLFRYRYNEQEYDIITEAKAYNFCNDWGKKNETFYTEIFKQCAGYYKTESDYYTGSPFIMILVFEKIKSSFLADAQSIMTKWNRDSDTETDFVALYKGDKSGLFVYGQIRPGATT